MVRDPEGEELAFALGLRLDTVISREAAHDPGVAPLHRIIEGWQLLEGRPVLDFRFWMARNTYQAPSPAQGRLYESFAAQAHGAKREESDLPSVFRRS